MTAEDNQPVLVVTSLEDTTADDVIGELNRRAVPVVRLDPGEFPAEVTLAARVGEGLGMYGTLRTASRTLNLSAVRAVYHRRPTPYRFDHLSGQEATFAIAQARHGLGGVLGSLSGALYVNHPQSNAAADNKPVQLATAVELGFLVPPTLITNDPGEARSFVASNGPAVYKPLRTSPYRGADGTPLTVWTQSVGVSEIDGTVRGTAHLFQQQVRKSADVRATVIGRDIFAVRISTDHGDGGILDWRQDYSRHVYTVIDLVAPMRSRLHRFLDRFGLNYGAFDFAETPSGDLVFLELNPNGQWGWLADATGLPMAASLAELLEKGAGDGP